MPFTSVAVTLPDDTPPAYVAGLLSACSQAYREGRCRSESEGSPVTATAREAEAPPNGSPADGDTRERGTSESTNEEGVILARITWVDPTTVTLLLGLPRWRNHRWLERSLSFKEQDQPLERYRALGFTVGSLAVTVAEVAGLEQEARESETATEAKALATKPATSPEPRPEASASKLNVDPAAVEQQPPTQAPWAPSSVFVRGYLAGELGEGFNALRRGGGLGLALFGEHWGGRVHGYYTDASGSGVSATLYGIELSADVRFDWQAVEANLCFGVGYGHLTAQVDKKASQVFPSGHLVINLLPSNMTIAPFVGVGIRMFRGFDTDVPQLGDLGPIAPFVQVGLLLQSRSPNTGETSR